MSAIESTAKVTKLFDNGGMQHRNTSSYSPSTFFGHRPSEYTLAGAGLSASTKAAMLTPKEASFQKDMKGAVDVILATAQKPSFDNRKVTYDPSLKVVQESRKAAEQVVEPNSFKRNGEQAVATVLNTAAQQKQAVFETEVKEAVNTVLDKAIELTKAQASFFYPTKDDANCASKAQQEAAVQSAISIPVLAR